MRENGETGEIQMDTKIGSYSYRHSPETSFVAGEVVAFICTSCNESLSSKKYENYALLRMKVDKNIEFDVLFSRVAGIQKTYLITEDGIETYSGN
jgi:hypothetical protein